MVLADRFDVLERVSYDCAENAIGAVYTIDEPAEGRAFEVLVALDPWDGAIDALVTAWWTVDGVRVPTTSANAGVIAAIERFVDVHSSLRTELFQLWKDVRDDVAVMRRCECWE